MVYRFAMSFVLCCLQTFFSCATAPFSDFQSHPLPLTGPPLPEPKKTTKKSAPLPILFSHSLFQFNPRSHADKLMADNKPKRKVLPPASKAKAKAKAKRKSPPVDCEDHAHGPPRKVSGGARLPLPPPSLACLSYLLIRELKTDSCLWLYRSQGAPWVSRPSPRPTRNTKTSASASPP